MPFDIFSRFTTDAIFALVAGVLGIYLTTQCLKAWVQARGTLHWQSTPGEVTTSWVKSDTRRQGGSYAIIKYTYTVMGQTYEGDKLTTADALDMRARGPQLNAKRVTDKYPRGSKVTVYYDPQNPANAVLRRDLNSPNGQGLLIVTILVGVVAMVLIGALLSKL